MGKCARALREEEGLTMKEFALMLGISAPTASQFENGRKSSEATAQKYADALGITVEKLKELALEYEEPEEEEEPKERKRRMTDPAGRVAQLMREKNLSLERLGNAIDRDWVYVDDVLNGYGEFLDDELRALSTLLEVDFTYLKAGGVKNAEMEAIKKAERQAKEALKAKQENEATDNTLAAVNFLLSHLNEISGSRDEKINAHRVLSNIRTEAEIKVLFK